MKQNAWFLLDIVFGIMKHAAQFLLGIALIAAILLWSAGAWVVARFRAFV